MGKGKGGGMTRLGCWGLIWSWHSSGSGLRALMSTCFVLVYEVAGVDGVGGRAARVEPRSEGSGLDGGERRDELILIGRA